MIVARGQITISVTKDGQYPAQEFGKELRHSKLHRLIPHILGLKKYQYAVLFLESGRKVRWILETHFGIDIH